MSASGAAVSTSVEPRALPRVAWLASIVLFGVLPVLTVLALFATAIQDDSIATDLRQFYGAAEAILDGDSPYTAAVATRRGRPVPVPAAPGADRDPAHGAPVRRGRRARDGGARGAALATLRVVGVRDWRCYGLALLWPPVLSAVQTGNVTLCSRSPPRSPGAIATGCSPPRRASG